MAYDREKGRAFWYDFDARTKYNPAIGPVLAAAKAFDIQGYYAAFREEGAYPEAFNALVAARREPWLVIASLHRQVFDAYFADDPEGLQMAFEDFGQGTLYDPDPIRAANDDMIHTMDAQSGSPPVGYHRWHASIRAIESLGPDDPQWWSRLAGLVGFAWAIQSAARPVQQHAPNPDMPQEQLAQLRALWLPMSAERLDAEYDRTGASGYHPAPYDPL